ncbi:MAG: hypothetical protein LBK63_13395 [Treponema sp.]|nr:hypothetical protein [Treponema sp.]
MFSCDLYEYGLLGGADVTVDYYPPEPGFEALLEDLSGVWYSHYAGIGRLDGYRIGRWEDFEELVILPGKDALIPGLEWPGSETYTGHKPGPGDYFLLYDSSVYGQADDHSPADEDWQGNFGFCGIVRGVNLFYDNPDRGAIIIEYLTGCYPTWLTERQGLKDGEKPFFGIYYRVLEPDIVQMANAVDLEALYNGELYYTETETLREAMDSNTVENEAEYIAWGVVIPQDREK